MDYRTLDAQLQGRNKDKRKIANNTYAIREEGGIALRLGCHWEIASPV